MKKDNTIYMILITVIITQLVQNFFLRKHINDNLEYIVECRKSINTNTKLIYDNSLTIKKEREFTVSVANAINDYHNTGMKLKIK